MRGKTGVVAAMILMMMLLGGCAKGEATVVVQQAVTEEKNSFADWQESLSVGNVQEVTAPAMRGLSIIKDGKPLFAVSYEPRTYKNSFDCWAISEPYQSLVAVDTERMYELFDAVAQMSLEPVTDVSLEDAGIGESGDSIYVAYYQAQGEGAGAAEPDRDISYRIGSQAEDGRYYVETEGALWLVEADALEQVFAVNPYDYILRIVSVVSIETVSEIDIVIGDECCQMAHTDEGYFINNKKVLEEEYYDLYESLMSVFIEKELTDENKVGEEPLLTITYHRNDESAPQITQKYYEYEGDLTAVEVNGSRFFLVSRTDLDTLLTQIELR